MLASTPLHATRAAGECYVKWDATGTEDGTSWADAYTTLQSALGTSPCIEIWVATGTYKPTSVTTERSATFQLKTGVALYGGFSGTETLRTERNPATNLTILSGDIDNNDTQTPIITHLATVSGNTLNSSHVVTGATGATLDGFTITAGYANDNGGGLYNASGSSPTVTNVIFRGNSASSHGGGMYNYSSSPAVTNVTFSGNSATFGGGMVNISSSSPTLTNVTFTDNSATSYGGGMYNSGSNPTLTNVTFGGNSATSYGGGMFNSYSSSTIHNTIFWGNLAPTGAQIHLDNSSANVSDSVVEGGYAGGTHILITDPKLGALGNYGGFTQTVPILAGSSAIDTGNDSVSVCPATDQRGVLRPQGAHCDIGAFEQDDIIAPTVDAFTATTPSNSLNIPISVFTASDAFGVTGYLITTSATVPSAGAPGWSGTAPTTYTVLSGGSYTLYPWAMDAAGNISAEFASPLTVVVDTIAPMVDSITLVDISPTGAASVRFTVTFSESVTGVDVGDFDLATTGVTGASITGVTGSGSVYTATVSTGSNNGSIRLDVPGSATITDLPGNPLASLPFTGGETYTITKDYKIYLPLILKQ